MAVDRGTRGAAPVAAPASPGRGLRKVGTPEPLGEYLGHVWHRRVFILTLAWYRIQAQNKRQRLGLVWLILRPVFDAVIYGVVFGLVLGTNRPYSYMAFIVVGVFMFALFRDSVNQGTGALTSSGSLIHSIRFQRMVLPLSEAMRACMNFLPVFAIMAAFVLSSGSFRGLGWLAMVPLMALYVLFNTGVALVFARLNAMTKDVERVVPFFTRLVFYSSGVFFSLDHVLRHAPVGLAVMHATPIPAFLGVARGLVMNGYSATPELWLSSLVWGVGMFVVGVVFFWRAEERYGQYV